MPEIWPKTMNEEFNKFLEETNIQAPKVEDAIVPPPEKEEEKQEVEEPKKNRHHRRLEKQLEEARIEAARSEARAQALLEMQVKTPGEVDPLLIQLYGADNKPAALIHQQLLESYAEKAREEAIKEFESNQASREQEVKQFESYIDEQFEGLEEQYNLDLTSNAPAARKARNEILELLERISPKDDSGNITEYADMDGVYEMWKLKREKGGVSNRQKEAAARSMEGGDNTPPAEKQPTPGFRGYLRDFGL